MLCITGNCLSFSILQRCWSFYSFQIRAQAFCSTKPTLYLVTLLTHSELAPGSLHLTFLILHFLIEQVASQDCQIALQSIPNLCNAIPLRCSQANPSMLLMLVQSTSACPRTNTSSKIRAGWVCKLRLRQPDRDSLNTGKIMP